MFSEQTKSVVVKYAVAALLDDERFPETFTDDMGDEITLGGAVGAYLDYAEEMGEDVETVVEYIQRRIDQGVWTPNW